MIIPRISARQFSSQRDHELPTENSLQRFIDNIRHWSLFGTVAITDVEVFSLQELETVVQAVGGNVDLEIEYAGLGKFLRDHPPTAGDGESIALALLNAGATAIVCSPRDAEKLTAIPLERIVLLKSENETGLTAGVQIALKNPSADQLSRWEQHRVDVLVDSKQLAANPNLITDFFQQILVSDRPDGLWSTLIVDPLGLALGLAYSNYESLLDAITHRRGTYWSRSRNELWIKGATSGAMQDLLGIRIDCDRDCLRFQVTQDAPGFCHRETHSCFGNERTIESVIERLMERIASTDEKSFTKKLVNDPEMLRIKLLEEARELSEAETPAHIAFEAADVLYFSLVKMLSAGVRLESVHQELARRMTRVVRRKNKLEPETLE